MIVLTSDHGDYLGDHWLGEKDLFHDCSARVPLIIYDPSPEADPTRGTVSNHLVEGIDLAPTFVEVAGGDVPDHILEGRSLLPLLHGQSTEWRDYAVSEYDYSLSPLATRLGVAPEDARLFMIADHDWKFMHAEGGFRPMLFDLKNDPQELHDLGADPAHADTIAMMYNRLAEWARRCSQRTTLSHQTIEASRGKSKRVGIFLGVYDGSEISDEERAFVTGKAPVRQTPETPQ